MRRIVLKSFPFLVLCVFLFVMPAFAGEEGDSTGMDWSRVQEYRIVPGDRLSIDFGQRADQPVENLREVRVRPDGRITVYPVGDVIAAGLTPMDLQKSLTSLLSAELRAPRVTVEVVELAGNVVHVLGRVESPGSYPAHPFVTALQAIAMAGGLRDDAARASVLIIHRDGARTVRVARLRVDRAMAGDVLADLPLSRFDIVYVPRTTVGNLTVFLQQMFSGFAPATSTALTGWELFNLDRVFTTQIYKN